MFYGSDGVLPIDRVPVLFLALIWLWMMEWGPDAGAWGTFLTWQGEGVRVMGTLGRFFFLLCPHLPDLPPAQGAEMGKQLFAIVPAPGEMGSISPMADSTSDELPLDLGICQAFLTTVTSQPEPPSPTDRTTTSKGSHGSGKAGRQLAMGKFLPAVATVGLIQLVPPCLALQAAWCHR